MTVGKVAGSFLRVACGNRLLYHVTTLPLYHSTTLPLYHLSACYVEWT